MKDLVIAITGQITKSNFPAFEKELKAKLDEAKAKELVTDQDFLDAKDTVKFCANTITAINKVKKQALAETADINELFRGLDRISESLRETGKDLDKRVKADFAKNKAVIVDKALSHYREYVDRLVVKTPEALQFISLCPEEFTTCTARRSKLHTIQAAIDTQLKLELGNADAIVTEVNIKLNALSGVMKTHKQLFPDHYELLKKNEQELLSVISGRIAAYKAEEDRKVEAEAAAEVARAKAAETAALLNDHAEKVKAATPLPLFGDKPVVQEPVSAPGFVDCPDDSFPRPDDSFLDPDNSSPVPPPFGSPAAVPDPAADEIPAPPVQDEEVDNFFIVIPLHCETEWVKKLAGDILAQLEDLPQLDGNVLLKRGKFEG